MNVGEVKKILELFPDETKCIITTSTGYFDLYAVFEEKMKLNDIQHFISKYTENSNGEVCLIFTK